MASIGSLAPKENLERIQTHNASVVLDVTKESFGAAMDPVGATSGKREWTTSIISSGHLAARIV